MFREVLSPESQLRWFRDVITTAEARNLRACKAIPAVRETQSSKVANHVSVV